MLFTLVISWTQELLAQCSFECSSQCAVYFKTFRLNSTHIFLQMDVLTLLITGISILLLAFTICGNFLVMAVIRKNKRLQNANTCLIFHLATSDFGFAIITFMEIIFVSIDFRYSSFQFVMNALTSIYFLVALAVERYFAILKPFVHMKRSSKSLIRKVILAVYILAGTMTAAAFTMESLSWPYAWKNATMNETNSSALANATSGTSLWLETLSTVYMLVLLAFGFVLPSAVMIFCYSRVIYHAWYNTEENSATNLALLKSRRKLTKLFIILTITFLFTWTPTSLRPIVKRFGNMELSTQKFQLFSMLLPLIGSAANPVIYSFRCPRFRQEVVKLLNCPCCRRKRLLNCNIVFAANIFSLTKTKTPQATVEPVSILLGTAG